MRNAIFILSLFMSFPLCLFISFPAFASDYAIDTYFDFGRRGESGTVEEEDLTDEFYYQRYDVKFLERLSKTTSYYIKYQYYHKDFDTLQNLDNNFHSVRVSLDTILYEKGGFSIKIGPDLELKEKYYKDSKDLDYDQIKFDLPFIFKREADWTIKATGGINSYHYPNAPKDQFKLNARFDIAKKLFDERLELAAFYKYQYIEREKIANRIEQTYGGSAELKMESPFIRAFEAGVEEGKDNTIIYEEREDSYDFKYLTWYLKTKHAFWERVKTTFKYADMIRYYADYNHNFDGFLFENNWTLRAVDTKESTLDLKLTYLHKQFRFPYVASPFDIHNNNITEEIEYEKKHDWKASGLAETKFYDFPAKRTNDKIYYRLRASVEKYLLEEALTVGFDYQFIYKNYLHKPAIIEDVFRFRATYKF